VPCPNVFCDPPPGLTSLPPLDYPGISPMQITSVPIRITSGWTSAYNNIKRWLRYTCFYRRPEI
jgi:hypothetical protein